MKNISLPTAKERPDLIKIDSLEDKLKSIYNYIKIETIYCDIANRQDYHFPEPENNLSVTEIGIPGGEPYTIKLLLRDYLEIMTDEIKSCIHGDDDFESIKEQLQRCAELGRKKAEENDTDNEFKYDGKFRYEVLIENKWSPALVKYLIFENEHLIELIEHSNIRKHFYLKLVEEFEKALDFHLQKTDLTKKPYTWDSPNAELEISELVFVLQILTQRIKIDDTTGATISKFSRDFFGLFCLSDKNYSKKIYQIGDRKFNESFLNELAVALQNFHEKK